MTLEAFLGHFGSQLSGGLLLALGIALVSGIVASAVCPCTLPLGPWDTGSSSVLGRRPPPCSFCSPWPRRRRIPSTACCSRWPLASDEDCPSCSSDCLPARWFD